MKKRLLAILLIMSMMLLLTGCGDELYEMTPEERKVIVDYSAHIVAKYNVRQPEGYTYVYEPKPTEEEDFSEFDTDATSGSAIDDTDTTSGGAIDEPDATSGSAIEDDGADTTPVGGDTSNGERSSLTEALGLGTLKAVFTGAQYCLKYDTFVPEYGCGLCVVNVTIENPTDHDIKLDMLSRLPKFKARINDSVNLKSSLTILLDDLSTFQGEIPAKGSKDTVIIFQFKDNSIMSIDKLTMSIEVDGNSKLVDLL